jgi:tartrate dehydrogenase/decarboxylase/D-malate dehydrogenase
MLFVREGTEGEYAGLGDRLVPGTDRDVALQTAVFSRHGVERAVLSGAPKAVADRPCAF